jgi:cation:H+ antiporter
MFWSVLFLVIGFAALIRGASALIDGSAGLARRYRISNFVIGLTLVAFGTSLPELAISLFASISGSSGLIVGNIVGSNIANVALILGLVALIRPLRFENPKMSRYEIPYIILAGLVLFFLGFDQIFQNHGVSFNRLTLGDGLILLLFFIIFLFYIFGNLKTGQILESQLEKKEKISGREPIWKLYLETFLGFVGVVGGGKLIVDNSLVIAHGLGVSEMLIGLTIVAVGTSLPEMVTSVVSVYKKQEDLAVGTIIGSNVINIFLILGLASVFRPIELTTQELFDVFSMISMTILLFFFAYFRKQLTKISGSVFLILYFVYIVFAVYRDVTVV